MGPASCPLTTVTNTNPRRVTYQKSEDLNFVTQIRCRQGTYGAYCRRDSLEENIVVDVGAVNSSVDILEHGRIDEFYRKFEQRITRIYAA